MTSATPKPRAGEHSELERLRCWNHRVSVCKEHVAAIVDGPCVICECDLLRERERELVEALSALIEGYGKWATRQSNAGEWLETQAKAKALLAKHGR